MLVIVAHHFVVNSGITQSIDERITFGIGGGYDCIVILFGWGGKTAINCFVLVTGWFMCRQEFRWRKLLSLYIEVKFYRIVIYLLFLLSGYEAFSLKEFYKAVFDVAFNFGKGFSSSFIAFYALVPFMNKFIGILDKKSHGELIVVLTVMYSVVPTFFLNGVFEYIGWYATLYLIAAYLRMYPSKWSESKKTSGLLSVLLLLLSWGSIACIYFVSLRFRRLLPVYWFVADSNKVLALLTSVAVFCFFKNISLGQNRFINMISSATFGVLLIHASSDTMRQWLWQDVCRNVWHFENDTAFYFIGYSALCTLCVFAVCVLIDLSRKFVQKQIYGLFLCLNKKQSQ